MAKEKKPEFRHGDPATVDYYGKIVEDVQLEPHVFEAGKANLAYTKSLAITNTALRSEIIHAAESLGAAPGSVKPVAYAPNDREARIIELIRANGRRMTKDEVCDEMEDRGYKGRSAVGESCGVLVRANLLTNCSDSNGNGYGLAEWSTV